MLSAHRKNDIIKIYEKRFVLLDILQYILSAISTVLSLVLIIMIIKQKITAKIKTRHFKPISVKAASLLIKGVVTSSRSELLVTEGGYNIKILAILNCALAHCSLMEQVHYNTVSLFCQYFHKNLLLLQKTTLSVKINC